MIYQPETGQDIHVDNLDFSFITDQRLLELTKNYVKWDGNEDTRKVIVNCVLNQDVVALRSYLYSRMQFGTAGLRGKMGPGFSNMNDLVIIQTTQGFVRYLERTVSEASLRMDGVVIGYDGRHNSSRFSQLATAAFVNRGYPVHLFSKMVPTPFVPFAVRLKGCCAGIMITASHNPKEDNGYKVYWQNGAQIISPHDKGIQAAILENCKPWESAWKIETFDQPLVLDPLKDVMAQYYGLLCDNNENEERNAASQLRITYTPMHGVGQRYMEMAFRRASLPDLISVPEQKNPDPEFPTVRFPNPEEGKSALNLAIDRANRSNSTLILANDPDADRLAVAEKQGNEWKIFNGNELGALLGWWCFHCYVEKYGSEDLANCYMLSSTVSSKILLSMAEKEGFNFEETLTGFKWMGNRADELTNAGKTVLFAFEEAIGFMCGTLVLDKDGISAGVKLAELAVHLRMLGRSLADQLGLLYERYGFHISCNSYYLCYQPEQITKMFLSIRVFDNSVTGLNYPSQLKNGKYKVIRVRDLTTGFDSGEPDQKAKLPFSKGSHMLTFTFDNGLVATLRTSGTEPKVKYYTELRSSPDVVTDSSIVKDTLREMVEAMLEEWVQPYRWGFIPPPDEDGEGDGQPA